MAYDGITINITINAPCDVSLWTSDRNSAQLTDTERTRITGAYIEEWSWTPVFSLQITDGVLGLYSRPYRIIYVYIEPTEPEVQQRLSPLEILFGIGNVIGGTIGAVLKSFKYVYGTVTANAQRFYEWAQAGIEWIVDGLSQALSDAAAWLWDHAGVYIYAVVETVVNALIDATVTIINILLIVVPLLIFTAIINFWSKFLKSFRIWYTKGYEAYAEYLEREMLKLWSVFRKGGTFIAAPRQKKITRIKKAFTKIPGAKAAKAGLKGARAAKKGVTYASDAGTRASIKARKGIGKASAESYRRRVLRRKRRVEKREQTSAEKRFNDKFGSIEGESNERTTI